MLFYLPRPKRPHQLPAVWAEEDVIKMIRTIDNLKHRLMLLVHSKISVYLCVCSDHFHCTAFVFAAKASEPEPGSVRQ